MDTKHFKMIMTVVMILVCCSGILPLKIPKLANSEWFLSYLNCFASGIFLSMALVHMMPEAVEIYSEWAESE